MKDNIFEASIEIYSKSPNTRWYSRASILENREVRIIDLELLKLIGLDIII